MPAKTPSDPVGKVGDYIIGNLTVFNQDWVNGLKLSIGAYNLFDEQYFDKGSPDHKQIGIQKDGLTLRLKANLNF